MEREGEDIQPHSRHMLRSYTPTRTRMRLPSNMRARGGEARSVDTELSRALERSEVIGASDRDRGGKLDGCVTEWQVSSSPVFYPFGRLSCLRNGRPERAADCGGERLGQRQTADGGAGVEEDTQRAHPSPRAKRTMKTTEKTRGLR